MAVFAVSAALLFGVSALYHRGHWGPRAHGVLKRLDHANIFLIIAGTYTPFAVLLLPAGPARTLLWMVWGGAIGGVAFRVLWVGAPRWLYVPVYIALGWVAVVYLPAFATRRGRPCSRSSSPAGCSTPLGGLVYGLRRPNPSPRWFGFHEVFHALTVLAFAAHCTCGLAVAVDGQLEPAAELAQPGPVCADLLDPLHRRAQVAEPGAGVLRRPAARTRRARARASGPRRPRPGCRAPAARAGAAGS